MSSRNTILKKLRAAQKPFTEIPEVQQRQNMVKLPDTSPDALAERFVLEAKKLGCSIYAVNDDEEAIEQILALVKSEKTVSAWDEAYLPVKGLATALEKSGIRAAGANETSVKYGITGVDSALAATGSLVLISGQGKYRTVSLLPEAHIMLVKAGQIIPDLEAWFVQQRQKGLDDFRRAANTVIVSGPSKTADIAQELILGAHGPKEIHIILMP
jgi:L-lactate dehydrogenase complex protein LldG